MQYLDPGQKQRDSQCRVKHHLPVTNTGKTDILVGLVKYDVQRFVDIDHLISTERHRAD